MSNLRNIHTHTHTNESSSGDGNRAGTGTGVESRGRTQDGNGDGSGDGNESSSGDGNEDEDGNGDRNEDGIGECGGEAKKRKKPHKNYRRDWTLSFRTRHHLCRQRVALADIRQLRSQDPMSVHVHRTKGVTGSKGWEAANGVGGEVGVGGGNGDGNEDGIGEGGREAKRRKKLRKSCRCHVGKEGDLGRKRKNADKKGLVQ